MDDSSYKPNGNRHHEAKRMDDFLVGWLEKPGNFARYARANGKNRTERRGDIGDEIYEAYRATGGTQKVLTIKARLWRLTQLFCKAHELACNGASRDLVNEEFEYYYRMVERLGEESNTPIYHQYGYKTAAEVAMEDSRKKPRSGTTKQQLNDDHYQEMMQMLDEMAQRQRRQHEQVMDLLDQRQELLDRQSERARMMEMQIEASMILSVSDRLRNVGFSEDEISLHIQLLQPLYNFHSQMNGNNVDQQQQQQSSS